MDYYGLDPCHYFSSPRLIWNAMVKITRTELEYIAKRHSKANNNITYLDTNNLHGQAMSQYLPYSGFKWLNQKEISDFCLDSISENSSIGYILKVYLEYSSELHDLHNDYPLGPEKLEISQNMLSKYCFDIANKYGIKIGGANKLVPNLGNKSKYVVHYRNLQLYLSLGIKLTKVLRILKFKQSEWLKKYIDFNTGKRKNAANSFEKNILN